jgi:quercetin dioxygenase-like cupin family protein
VAQSQLTIVDMPLGSVVSRRNHMKKQTMSTHDNQRGIMNGIHLQRIGGSNAMPKYFAGLAASIAIAFAVTGTVQHSSAGAATPQTPNATTIGKEILGQGASAVAPDRVLLLQRRTFAPGSDSGAHPAPGPTVLFVDSGTVEFTVDEGAALLTRRGATEQEPVAAGDEVDLEQGDAVFYDEGVVHDVANVYDDPAVTLEARLNPPEMPSQQ